ncbi:MAG: hypothetical protein ACYDA8_09760 [Deferrisomatales bacterium]
MGHAVGKDLYRALGDRIDGLATRAPWNEAFRAILRELYTEEEAELVAAMPAGLAGLHEIARATGYEPERLRGLLEGTCAKGLTMDLWANGEYRYMPSPLVVGIFEFTMMRTRGSLDTKKWAGLFHEYMQDAFYGANCGHGETVGPIRAFPHEGVVARGEYTEILDYERAGAVVEEAKTLAIGLCSCRHERSHLGEKRCDVPLETCSTFGKAADFMVRRGLAREVSREEMQDNLQRSRDLGLAFCGDNVRRNVTFL